MKICIFADIHGNNLAFQAVLNSVKTHNSVRKVHQFWFLGDLVGRGPDPDTPLEWLNAHISQDNWVMGNHEAILAERLPFGVEETVEPLTLATIRNHRQSELMQAWVNDRVHQELDNHQSKVIEEMAETYNAYVVIAHASHDDPLGIQNGTYGNLLAWEATRLNDEFKNIYDNCSSYSHVIKCFGHTHVPLLASASRNGGEMETVFVQPFQAYELNSERAWLINPGSVGCTRDADTRAAYAILEFRKEKFPTVTFYRVRYNLDELYRELLNKPYPFINTYHEFFDTERLYPDTPELWKEHFRRMREVKE